MTTRVWLVRHASTDWTGVRWCGRTDLALSPPGRAEAVALASRLAVSLPPDLQIRSSPLRRAVETAHLIATRLGVEVAIDKELREVDFGEAEGRTWDELRAALPGLASALLSPARDIDWPGGDRAVDIRRRASSSLGRAIEAPTPCLLVTHGGLIRELLRAAGADTPGQVIPPAGALVLRCQAEGWALDATEPTL